MNRNPFRIGPRYGKENGNWKGGLPKCPDCGIQLKDYISKKCRSCSHIGLKNSLGRIAWNKDKKGLFAGKDNPNWKGGITPLYSKIRHLDNYYEWRKLIFERDNYTCQICNQKCNQLHVDHFPITFSDIIKSNNIKNIEDALNCKELWNFNNARTLCLECHKGTTTYLKNHNFKYRYYA